jgi:hypothetical protein
MLQRLGRTLLKTYRFSLPAFLVMILPLALQAGVIVNTTLNLNGLSITPDGGTLQYLTPFSASAFADAHDSQGGADSNFDSQDDSTATASALAILASANGSADAVNKVASAGSFINIPDIDASAGSTGQGTLIGYFQIIGAPGTVNVTISASLSGNQLLTTTGYGVSASSEIVFSLILPDFSSDPFLFLDNPMQIGPNQSASHSTNTTLSNSLTLQTNTPYFLLAEVDSESAGVAAVPEPSCILFGASGTILILLRRRKR